MTIFACEKDMIFEGPGSACYGPNYIPPKFICLSSNPSMTAFGEYGAFMEVIKVIKVGLDPVELVSL